MSHIYDTHMKHNDQVKHCASFRTIFIYIYILYTLIKYILINKVYILIKYIYIYIYIYFAMPEEPQQR